MNIRRQLTLFIEKEQAITIEKARQKFNPKQFELIDCHVTLCREDEIERLDKVLNNLSQLSQNQIVINFNKVKRFGENKGVLLPSVNETTDFDNLRKLILKGIIEQPRKQEPHITIMHPRNSTCDDAIFEEIKNMDFPNEITFKKISLIEQIDGGKWNILQEFEFCGCLNSAIKNSEKYSTFAK